MYVGGFVEKDKFQTSRTFKCISCCFWINITSIACNYGMNFSHNMILFMTCTLSDILHCYLIWFNLIFNFNICHVLFFLATLQDDHTDSRYKPVRECGVWAFEVVLHEKYGKLGSIILTGNWRIIITKKDSI